MKSSKSFFWLIVVAGACSISTANEITLYAVRDAAILNLEPNNNMGAHSHVPVGVSNNNRINHALFDFEITEILSSGIVIESAEFQFEVSQQGGPQGQSGVFFDLHRVTQYWDEGTGDANGGSPTMDGATWLNATATEMWADPGGDFEANVSGSVFVNGSGPYSISSDQLVADIQNIIEGNVPNLGFLMKPAAMVPGSAARVLTREFGVPARLVVTFSVDDVLFGDVNLDGEVSLLDVAPFVDRLINGVCQAEADINQDGTVDLLDVGLFVDIITGS